MTNYFITRWQAPLTTVQVQVDNGNRAKTTLLKNIAIVNFLRKKNHWLISY